MFTILTDSAAYTIRVRSAEFSNDPATLQEVVRRALAAGEECDVT